jgi:hypothetical protein
VTAINSHSRAIAGANALARGLAKTNVATEFTVPLPLFVVTNQGTLRSSDGNCEEGKDDGGLEEPSGNPAIPRFCAVGPEALRRRLSTVMPLSKLS